MAVKTVMVDFDNTLHDTDGKFASKLDGFLGLDGKFLWDTLFYEIHRKVVHEKYPEKHQDALFHFELLLKRLNEPPSEKLILELSRRYGEAEKECWEKPAYFGDALPFLDGLKKLGFKICLTTGAHAKEKAEGIERRASKKYFDHVFDERGLGYAKQNPKFYALALAFSSSRAEESASVGDTLINDVLAPRSIGMKAIWVNRKGSRSIVNHEVKNLMEALKLLEEWGRT